MKINLLPITGNALVLRYKGMRCTVERGKEEGDPHYIGTLDTGDSGDIVCFHGDSLHKVYELFKKNVDWYKEFCDSR